MNQLPLLLVCFALKTEAGPFTRRIGLHPRVRTLLTGMGQANAQQGLCAALASWQPEIVLTCGFAGGLRPELATGTVLFAAGSETGLMAALAAAGARPARFHSVQRVATTAEEKMALWEKTGADAVEMESQVIRDGCRERGIPSAIVRVILDTTTEDLPLDFNRLMTHDYRLDTRRLALALVKSPGKVAALLRLQKQARAAAERLGEVLWAITSAAG